MGYMRTLTNVAGTFTVSRSDNDATIRAKEYLFWYSPIGLGLPIETPEERATRISEEQARHERYIIAKRRFESRHLMLKFTKRVFDTLEQALKTLADNQGKERRYLLEAIRDYASRYEHFHEKYIAEANPEDMEYIQLLNCGA